MTAARAAPGPRAPGPSLPPGRVIITIDGPAGTGKSSVARTLAQRLGLDFLDTGAMYRAAAALALDARIDPEDHPAVLARVRDADVHFDWHADPPAIIADGRPLGGRIRDADVTAIVSPLASIPALRQLMVALQRHVAQAHPRLVTEGRDQGSVVFPDAPVKIYLDATLGVRAARRADQLRAAGHQADELALMDEIRARDASDSRRHDGPLRCPDDAVVLDTSPLTFDQVVERLEDYVRARLHAAVAPGGQPADRAGGGGGR